MVCDKCDPTTQYRRKGLENALIPLPVISVNPENKKITWEVAKCKFCSQGYLLQEDVL